MYLMSPYDEIVKKILDEGQIKENRTGEKTRAIFGTQTRYRIDEYFPILTRRKVWPKAVFGELITFISGKTTNSDFVENKCKFWTPWVDEEWAKSKGYVSDAFGPIYGFQLRYFDGYYGNGKSDQKNYGKGGFDQLNYVIDLLKNNPNSRRILFDLWNPKNLGNQRLPPCHYSFQLFVNDDKLSGMLTQRSADWYLGSGANICFYSALIYMLSQQCGYEPFELVYSTGDTHIYENQLDGIEEYLSRDKPDSPQLILHKAEDIGSYTQDCFRVVDYNPLPPINVSPVV